MTLRIFKRKMKNNIIITISGGRKKGKTMLMALLVQRLMDNYDISFNHPDKEKFLLNVLQAKSSKLPPMHIEFKEELLNKT